MYPVPRALFVTIGLIACCGSMLIMAGCGGRTGNPSATPISVSLPVSRIVVMPSGAPVTAQIQIVSTSETALVMVSGLPGGIQEKYAASDTNPSGILTFTAAATTHTGTYMPTITVDSAGQTASTTFTLIVK